MIIPFVVMLFAMEIVPAAAESAPKELTAPTGLLKVRIPLPHASVNAGFDAMPSPFKVLLNVIL